MSEPVVPSRVETLIEQVFHLMRDLYPEELDLMEERFAGKLKNMEELFAWLVKVYEYDEEDD